jgi:hypothetical protein
VVLLETAQESYQKKETSSTDAGTKVGGSRGFHSFGAENVG